MALNLLINYEIFVKALLIVIIVICSSFLGGTLNCDLQKTLITNPIFRHLILYLVLFLVLDYTGNKTTAPTTLFTNSLFIYGTFILLTKQTGIYLYANILIILCIYILSIQQRYENNMINQLTIENTNNIYNQTAEITIKNNNNITLYQKNIKLYQNIKKYILLLSITLLMIGFLVYFDKKLQDYGDKFDFIQFIFGTNKCRQLL